MANAPACSGLAPSPRGMRKRATVTFLFLNSSAPRSGLADAVIWVGEGGRYLCERGKVQAKRASGEHRALELLATGEGSWWQAVLLANGCGFLSPLGLLDWIPRRWISAATIPRAGRLSAGLGGMVRVLWRLESRGGGGGYYEMRTWLRGEREGETAYQ